LNAAASLLVFVPVLGSFIAHAPVLRYGWLPRLCRPVDGGATLFGRRVFGDNKTWRGAIVMAAGVLAATLLLSSSKAYWSRLPAELQHIGPLLTGVLLGLGTILGELPGSLVKRQLGIAPGEQQGTLLGALLSLWDQGDFVFGIWVLLLPVWRMPLAEAALAFVVVAAAHLALSAVGYAIGARRTVL
jgi:CDP-2,3-bis-(O-geranylgeranyl)-sn-glycerol synthase